MYNNGRNSPYYSLLTTPCKMHAVCDILSALSQSPAVQPLWETVTEYNSTGDELNSTAILLWFFPSVSIAKICIMSAVSLMLREISLLLVHFCEKFGNWFSNVCEGNTRKMLLIWSGFLAIYLHVFLFFPYLSREISWEPGESSWV